MGMTIDDHIEVLKSYHNGFTGYAGNFKETIDVAVDIMNKYQKIQKIVNSNPDYIHYTDMDAYKVNSIREVVEDGNNDR